MALEMSKPASEGKNHCCISHEFVRAASKAPAKVAVIHALGGARIAGERQSMAVDSQIEGRNNDAGGFLRETVYEGDQCFTFSDLLASVDSLSCRLRRILDGGDDPHLLRPSGDLHSDKSLEVPVSTLSKPSSSRLEQSIDLQNMIMPKIVGLYMVPSIEYIVGVLSVLRCGEAFLPLDPSWPEEKITSAVSSSKADLILSCRSFFEGSCSLQHDQSQLLANCTKCPVLWLSMEECLAECYDSSNLIWPCENSKRRLFCYLMYTSGSTGKPKGVCGTEDGLLNRFLWMQESYPLLGEEFLLFKTAISFIDHLQEFISAVLATCTLVIPPLSKLKENLFYVVDFLQVYAIDRLISVPSLMRAVLPVLRSPVYVHIQTSLKLLVLSGEVLSLSLWHNLSNLLPKTSILNLYGSTEVSGDCTYFDCKRLPTILETESLSSVPIGRSISNCYVLLSGENDTTDQGELCVGGSCVSIGYLSDNTIMPLEYVSLFKDPLCESSEKGKGLYFKTGDFAKQLRTGDFVFMGRNDRIIKVNAQRIALEEIENTFRRHPDIEDAAVTFCKCQEDFAVLVAFIISKLKNKCCKNFNSSIRSWMINKLPLPMIPSHFFYMESFPMSSTGKVDYVALEDSSFSMLRVQDVVHHFHDSDLLEVIKKWEVELEGRIECSTSVVSDFSQVVAGCYEGKIYFIDFSNGKICWSFQTFGEVKSQPVVDVSRHLVWCGSYDHNLYALDYRDYCCAYKLACGGSIYGSPAIDEVCDTLYVASTSGRVTALSIKDLKFNILWLHELEVPVFGSLSISPLDGNVICCLVDGHVVALDASGCVSWKVKTGGPIFAGSCISHALVSQVLICSRNGSIYSFGLETGSLLWEYNVGDPITASAYVDENLNLLSSPSHPSDRLVCICTSSGNVHLLRINMNAISNFNQSRTDVVRELARLNLQGDIFSSPVMIAGRIFVGCRDDYVHCIGVEGLI